MVGGGRRLWRRRRLRDGLRPPVENFEAVRMSRAAWDHSFDNVMHEPILLWRAGGIRQAELLAADGSADVKQARGALDKLEVLDGQLGANARELVGLEQLLLRGLLRETI